MIWSTLTAIVQGAMVERTVVCVCIVLLIGLGVLYFRSIQRSRRRDGELDEREERHKIALALASQNIERHEQDVLATEISERRRVEASLSHAARHDRLTGLINRSFFLHELRNVLEYKSPRSTLQRAILCIDIDGFKAVNDTMGPKFGDLLIREVARRLNLCARERDVLARIGGDEFAMLLHDINGIDHALRISQRILSMIEEPALLADIRLSISTSIGLCEIDESYINAEDILRDADIAMHHAKRQGGGRCVSYDGSLRSEAFAVLQLKQQLRTALTNEEFVNFYMPIVNMADRSLYGMEALVRWNHPVRGLLAPGEFIQTAEESDLIVGIGTWVLRKACFDFQKFQALSARPLILSVNVSSRQLDQECFLDELSSIIQETGIAPASLQLELLESALIANAQRMGALFSHIRALGVKIAFDDFGTGYSSLSYLARYPIDTLKIDQSFVRDMKRGSVNADIVQLVIKLAHTIGMQVCAEGVEEEQQAADLVEYGCLVAQGYLYGRPVSSKEIIALITRDPAKA